MFFDGNQIWGTGFNVAGNNYFKLRDIADSLSKTSSRFDLTWNSEQKLIEIVTGAPYIQSDEKTNRWYSKGQQYFGTVNNAKILADGKEYNVPVFQIDGSNHFKLRDLSEIVGFDMVWNDQVGQVLLSSKLPENAIGLQRPMKIIMVFMGVFLGGQTQLLPIRPKTKTGPSVLLKPIRIFSLRHMTMATN